MTGSNSFATLLEIAQNNDATASIKKWKKAGASNSLIQELVNQAGASGNKKVAWDLSEGQKALKDLGLDIIPEQAEKASESLSKLDKTKFSNIKNSAKELGSTIQSSFGSKLNKAKGTLKTFGTSIKSVFTGVVSTIKSSLTAFAAVGVITAAVKGVTALKDAIQKNHQDTLNAGSKNIEKFQKDIDSYEEKLDKVKSIQEEFNNLSVGVDNTTNENIGLSTSEYERYLELKKELISINGDLVSSYNSEGEALINNSTAIQDTIDKYEKLIKTAKEERVLQDNLDIQNASFVAKAKDLPDNNASYFSGVITNNEKIRKQAEKILHRDIATGEKLNDSDLLEIANNSESLNQMGVTKIVKDAAKIYKEYQSGFKELVQEYKDTTLTNLVEGSADFEKLSGAAKSFASNLVDSLQIDSSDFESEDALNNIESRVRNIMKLLQNSSDFKTKLSDFYSLTSDTSMNAGEWQTQINNQFKELQNMTGLNAEELALTLGVKVELDDGELKNVLNSTGQNVQAMIKDLNKKFADDIKSNAVSFSDSELQSLVSNYRSLRSKRESKGSNIVGNVDLNDRPVILNDDGSYSTVKSSSMAGADGGAFAKKEIMYTPILSTTGEELDEGTMAKYISSISSKATTEEELLKLDSKGMEINGKKIKNVIEGVADSVEEANQKTAEFHNESDQAYSGEAEALRKVKDYLKETLDYQGAFKTSGDFDKLFSKDYFGNLSLEELSQAYDIVTDKNDKFTGSLDQLKKRLDNLKKYQSSGKSYSLSDYTAATQTTDDDADYNTFVSGLKQTKSDYDAGKVGTDQFKTMAGLISPTGSTSDKDFIENYNNIKKYFTEDNKGSNRFLKDLSKQTDSAGKAMAVLDKETGKYRVNIDNTTSAAKKLGMGLQPFESMLNNLKTYGHDVSFTSLTEQYAEVDDMMTRWSNAWEESGGQLGDKQGQEIEAWKQKIEQARQTGLSIPDEWTKIINFKVNLAEYEADLQKAEEDYQTANDVGDDDKIEEAQQNRVEAADKILKKYTGGSRTVGKGGLLADIDLTDKQIDKLQGLLDKIQGIQDNDKDGEYEDGLYFKYRNATTHDDKIKYGDDLVKQTKAFVDEANKYLPESSQIDMGITVKGLDDIENMRTALATLDGELEGTEKDGYSIKITADDEEAQDKLAMIKQWNEEHPECRIDVTADASDAESMINSLRSQYGDENMVMNVDANTVDALSKIKGVSVMKIGDKWVAIYGKGSDAENEIQKIDGITINGKDFTITAKDQSTGLLGTIQSMINGIHDKDVKISVTKTITTIQNTIRHIQDFFFGGSNKAKGTASFAKGTAFASGSIPKLSARALAFGSLSYAGGKDIGADSTSTSLVGELGPEMRIPAGTNRWELIGQHGAEFTKIRRGDIIFNHQQTASLLKSGRTNGRAQVHGGSSAFAHGTAFARGTSGTAYASGTKKSAIEKYAESVGNRFDFVAIKLDRLAKSVDSFANQINDFVSSTTKTKALWNQYSAVGKEISGQKSAQSRYSKEASDIRSGALKKVKKSQRKTLDTYFTRVRNGGFNINTISDDGMRQIVQEYQDAYEKMLDCKYAIQELQNEQRELFNQWLDMPLEDAQKKVDSLADSYSNLNSLMDLSSSGGSAMEILSSHEQYHINSANRNKDTNSWKTQLKNNVLVGTSYLDKPAYEYQNKLLSDAVTNTTNQVNTYIKALRTAEKNYAKYNKSGSSTQKADAKRALDELQNKVNEAAIAAAQARIDSAVQSQENIKTYFDSQYSYLEGALTKSENLFDLKEAKGLDVTDIEYEDRLNTIMDLRKTKLEEQAQMQKNLDAQIKKGYITKGTQEYYELQAEIDAVGEEVTKLDISAEELKDTMRDDIFFRGLERAQKAAENLQNSLETISDLIDEDAFFDDKGNLTAYGEAYLASNIANIKSLKDSLKTLLEERETIEKLYNEGYYSETEYTKKVQENEENLADAIKSIKSAEDTVIDVIKNNAKEKIDATNDMIDAYKKALQSEKDYYEYDKNLKSSNKEIQQLQNQIAALNGVADAASRAEKARLEEQLQDAIDSRDDTIKDHIYTLKVDGLDDLSDMLDDNYEKYVKELAQDIGKIEEALKDVTNTVHDSSSSILSAWEEILKHYGISGSDLGLSDSNLTGFASGGLVKAVNKNGDSGIASLKSGEEVVVEDTVRFAGELLPKLKSLVSNPTIGDSQLSNGFTPSIDLEQLQSNNELNIYYDNLMEIQKIEGLADMSEKDLQKLMEACYKYTNDNIIKTVAKRLGIKRQF